MLEIPSTINTLKIFEPKTLPMAMSEFPLNAATAEVTSSGSEVPMATTVKPISASEMPNSLAMLTDESTISFPPK